MRTLRHTTILALLLYMTGVAGAAGLKLIPLQSTPGFIGFLVAGKGKEIAWIASGMDSKTVLKIELLKNGSPVRVLASGIPVTKAAPNAQGELFGFFVWTPNQSDIGCAYSIKVGMENGAVSANTETFGIFEAYSFSDSSGNQSSVRLDSPNSGVLTIGSTSNITWSMIAFPQANPTGKIKLELYFQNGKVGDIAEIPLDFSKCPVKGQYAWTVGKLASIVNPAMIPDGKNLMAGNNYQIHLNNYLGGTFVIALPGSGGKPVPGGAPLPKVPKGGRDTIKN
jgi:hypothetical protein